MSDMHDILVLQRSRNLPPKLRETLRGAGFSTRTVFKIRAAIDVLPKLTNPIVIIDCGETPQGAMQTIQEVVDSPDLCDYPCLVIADHAVGFSELFDHYFILARGIDAPCGSQVVLSALNEVTASYHEYQQRLAEIAPDKAPAALPAAADSAELPKAEAQDGAEDVLFAELHKLDLASKRIGGRLYERRIDADFLRERKCYPTDRHAAEAVEALCSRLSLRERQHLFRTAFITGQSAKALELPGELRERAAAAAFLLGESFADTNTNMLKLSYLRSDSSRSARERQLLIADSADKLREMELQGIAAVLDEVAACTRGEACPDDDESLAAALVAAADSADRFCFHSGYWDPRAAYNFLWKIASGKLNHYPPKVVLCILKLLIESIECRPPAFLVPKELRHKPELHEARRAVREAALEDDEQRVNIVGLKPGMRLTRPLLSFDGRLILAPNLTLDKDLIWRLWRLASIRPLNTPLVIKANPGEHSTFL